jgi:uncharacterized iron-regulated membrane protein
MPGKILAFFISLICASLPVTGFLVWWNKKKTPKKKKDPISEVRERNGKVKATRT